MLFWLFVILMVAGIVLLVLNNVCEWFEEWADGAGWACALIGGVAVAFMFVIIMCNLGAATGDIAEHQEQYKALVYKQQTETCRDELGLLNKEYIDEVQEWNKQVVSNKAYHENFWIGIFNPATYEGVDVIDLQNITFKQ